MANVPVYINGKNNLGKATSDAKKDLASLGSAAQSIGGVVTKALAFAGVAVSVKALGDGIRNCFKEFETASRAYKQLYVALGDDSAYRQATSSIQRLSKMTLASKGDIEAMYSQLAALGKSSDEIDRIAEASINLSNVTGKDLNTSMRTLLGTYQGNTSALKKMGIDVSDLTKKQLESGAAIKEINKQFGEFTKVLAEDSTSQHLKNLKTTFEDIKEAVGGTFEAITGESIAKLDTFFESISGNIQTVIFNIGAVIKNLPQVARISFGYVYKMIVATFDWKNIQKIFVTMFKNIVIMAQSAIETIFHFIPSLLKNGALGFGNWFMYIATNFKIAILEGISGAINEAGRNMPGWAKKLFGIGEKLENFRFDVASAESSAAGYLSASQDAFKSIGESFGEEFENRLKAAKLTGANIANLVSDIYGDIGNEFARDIATVINPTLEKIKKSADVVARGAEGGSGGNKDDKEQSKFRKYLLENKNLNDLLENIGNLGKPVLQLFDTIKNGNVWVSMMMKLVQAIVENLLPAINATIAPLMDTFDWFAKSMADTLLPVLNQLYPVIRILAEDLQASLMPTIRITVQAIETIMPIINAATKAFVYVEAGAQTIADCFSYVGQIMLNFGQFVKNVIRHPLNPSKWDDHMDWSFHSDNFRKIDERLKQIDAGSTVASDAVSTNTAISSAGYHGATNVTINIYQQAPVVGDAGMMSFARMIRDEFDRLDYYSV